MKNLFKKLLEIQKEIPALEKEGENTFQNYKYTTEAQVKAAVRDLLSKHNVIFRLIKSEIIKVENFDRIDKNGTITGKNFLTTVRVYYAFIDADSEEMMDGFFDSTGHDTLDKGAFKAITGAVKYILMNQFLIPTGDDPEKNNPAENKKENRNSFTTAQSQKHPTIYVPCQVKGCTNKKARLWTGVSKKNGKPWAKIECSCNGGDAQWLQEHQIDFAIDKVQSVIQQAKTPEKLADGSPIPEEPPF